MLNNGGIEAFLRTHKAQHNNLVAATSCTMSSSPDWNCDSPQESPETGETLDILDEDNNSICSQHSSVISEIDLTEDHNDFDDDGVLGDEEKIQLQGDETFTYNDPGLTQAQSDARDAFNLLHALNVKAQSQTAIQHRSRALQKLIDTDLEPKTVIAVLGATGVGKSAFINALLEEECLIPTNGSRACTAVSTVIAYNPDPGVKYKAQIEMISREEWRTELELAADGVSESPENLDDATEAALAKVKAVYPQLQADFKIDVDELLGVEQVSALLDQEQVFSSSCPEQFSSQLATFLDSTGQIQSLSENFEDEPQIWPLVRVVKVFARKTLLSSGAVLVDLPGVQDSNVGRASVARNFLKNCNFFWIVTNIQRAVDDKTAQDLLSDSLKRQLQLDGKLNRVCCICTKTDDIVVNEVRKNLLVPELHEISKKVRVVLPQEQKLRRKATAAEKARKEAEQRLLRINEQILNCRQQQEALLRGEFIETPTASTLGKRHRDNNKLAVVSSKLELRDVEKNFNQLERQRKAADGRRTERVQALLQFQEQHRQLEDELNDLTRKEWNLAVSSRNGVVQNRVRANFVKSIKAFNMSLQAEKGTAIGADKDHEHYRALRNTTKVFCVSSLGYQVLHERLTTSAHMPFRDAESTGVPEVQRFVKELSKDAQLQALENFLNDSRILVDSMRLWALAGKDHIKLSSDEMVVEQKALLDHLYGISAKINDACQNATKSASTLLHQNILSKVALAANSAPNQAMTISDGWAGPQKNGGLSWNRYRAVCKGNGTFSSRASSWDFNADLGNLLINSFFDSWQNYFSEEVPQVFDVALSACCGFIKEFQSKIDDYALGHGMDPTVFKLLSDQLKRRERSLKSTIDHVKGRIANDQAEANRLISPHVTDVMQPAYRQCAAESGPGTYTRMR